MQTENLPGVGNGKEAEKEQTGVYPRGCINSFYATVGCAAY
jgi:hypothetical protein